MIAFITERQKTLIVNNIVAACKDITKLNRTGYNFIYQASGFIAHYDICGFINEYQNEDLKSEIIANRHNNMWTNFCSGDQNYDYYMSRADVYKRILSNWG